MKFKSFIAFSILVPFLTSTAIILAQTSLDDDSKNDIEPTSPLVTAMKVETPPVLDGEVLNDAAWEAAKAVTGFWQTTPDQGQAELPDQTSYSADRPGRGEGMRRGLLLHRRFEELGC
ncbi:hypothetical protein IH922_04165 [candidate division KSB1 bacterium]|nr:hypothetical protein [candidate division KSB1 bacterium]